MPKLTFDDVFLTDKEDVIDKIRSLQKQTQVQSIVLTHLMMEAGIRTVVVNRKEFTRRLDEEGLNEPLNMVFDGDGEHVRLTIGNVDDDDSDSR